MTGCELGKGSGPVILFGTDLKRARGAMSGKAISTLLATAWLAVGYLLSSAGGAVAAGNPLIGTWRPTESNCATTYAWTQTQQTTSGTDLLSGKPWSSTITVTFNTADPHKIFVIGNSSMALGFYILDPGTIRLSTYPGCTYKRLK